MHELSNQLQSNTILLLLTGIVGGGGDLSNAQSAITMHAGFWGRRETGDRVHHMNLPYITQMA